MRERCREGGEEREGECEIDGEREGKRDRVRGGGREI